MSDAEDDAVDAEAVAHSRNDRIVAKVNDAVVEGDWQTMKQLGKEILAEAEKHKTDLQRAKEMPAGVHIRVSCDHCGEEYEAERASNLTNTPEEHADHPDFDCTLQDVSVEAFCPRHGVVPLDYDECDGCADARAVINR